MASYIGFSRRGDVFVDSSKPRSSTVGDKVFPTGTGFKRAERKFRKHLM